MQQKGRRTKAQQRPTIFLTIASIIGCGDRSSLSDRPADYLIGVDPWRLDASVNIRHSIGVESKPGKQLGEQTISNNPCIRSNPLDFNVHHPVRRRRVLPVMGKIELVRPVQVQAAWPFLDSHTF